MKKALALALVLMLAMGMIGALAAITPVEKPMSQVPETQLLDASATTNTVTITKNYTVNGTEAVNPSDTLEFSVTGPVITQATSGVSADGLGITIGANKDNTVTVEQDSRTANVVVNLPAYSRVGVYTYTITEQNTNVAGVTYYTTPMTLVVTVAGMEVTDPDTNVTTYSLKAIPAVHCEAEGTKTASFTNTYDAGSLAVKKTVSGSLGDRQKVFNFTVTFTAPAGDTVNAPISYSDDGTAKTVATTAWTKADGATSYTATATITLKHDETVTFNNIPAGTTYSIVETEANTDEYTTTPTNETGTITANVTSNAVFNNEKNPSVDTGITLDTLPYVMLLAFAAVGAALLIARRRRED